MSAKPAFQIGERKIIEIFLKVFGKPEIKHIPIGDDVAGFEINKNLWVILKVDCFVDKTDMPPGMSFRQAGWKAMIMSISDFACKNVIPKVALVNINLPSNMDKKSLTEVALGLKDAAKMYGIYILGGDTNEASNLTITTIISGLARFKDIILRSKAKPGDLLAVSGKFGKTSCGLKILLENLNAPEEIKKKLLKAVYKPKVKLNLGFNLKKLGVTSSIDSSDGLAWSLYELSNASNVGFIIKKLPIAEEAKIFAKINKLDPIDLTFYGGEEYEVIATLNPKIYEKAKNEFKRKFMVIGEVVKEKKIVYIENGKEVKIKPKGWEHFKMNKNPLPHT
ncbi:MAG: thiamine-phosphate kinase [Candidatus Bathyarchaeota archaeon]